MCDTVCILLKLHDVLPIVKMTALRTLTKFFSSKKQAYNWKYSAFFILMKSVFFIVMCKTGARLQDRIVFFHMKRI